MNIETVITIKPNQRVFCPYCAYEGDIVEFRYKIKKGYSKKYYQCPDCMNIMRKKTLTKEITIKEWAQWAYANCKLYWREGQFKRFKFEKLFSRLNKYGISYEFWAEWRKAKLMSANELRKIIDDYYEDDIKQSDIRNKFYEAEIDRIYDNTCSGDCDYCQASVLGCNKKEVKERW